MEVDLSEWNQYRMLLLTPFRSFVFSSPPKEWGRHLEKKILHFLQRYEFGGKSNMIWFFIL